MLAAAYRESGLVQVMVIGRIPVSAPRCIESKANDQFTLTGSAKCPHSLPVE